MIALFVASAVHRAEAAPVDGAAILVLPLAGAPESEALEEHLLSALQRRGGRALAIGDVPEARLVGLPGDLSRCRAPDCLRRLADASGAGRVLSVRFLDEGGGLAAFATLYDAERGRVLRRGALGRAGLPARVLAEEIARWSRGDPPAPPPVPLQRVARPLIGVDVATGAGPEARALADAVLDALSRHPELGVAPGQPPGATHRALIAVEHASVVVRPHHVHRYRAGLLVATLAIVDLRDGTRVFQQRAVATLDERAQVESDGAAMARLQAVVVAEWMTRFRADSVERALTRRP